MLVGIELANFQVSQEVKPLLNYKAERSCKTSKLGSLALNLYSSKDTTSQAAIGLSSRMISTHDYLPKSEPNLLTFNFDRAKDIKRSSYHLLSSQADHESAQLDEKF